MIRQLHRLYALLVLVTLVGFALRVYQLDRQSFRGDEAFTVQYWMMVPVSETIEHQLTVDPQPLLAYALFNGWGQFTGIGEYNTRLLPVLFGTLLIPTVFVFAYRITQNRTIALLAAILCAIQPFLIWHSQDTRNYAPWVTVSLMATTLGLGALERSRRSDWAMYGAFTILASYLYYLDFFNVFALACYALIAYWGQWRKLLSGLVTLIVVFVALAPWYLQPALRGDTGYGGTTTGFDIGRLLFEFPVFLNFGPAGPSANWFSVVLLVGLIVGCAFAVQHLKKRSVALFFLIFLPLILLSLVSLRLSVFAPRYILATAPIWLVAFSVLIYGLWKQRRIRRFMGAAIAVGFISVSSFTLASYFLDYTKSPDWAELAAYLAEWAAPNDLVIQAAADASFGYYYHHDFAIVSDERALPADPTQSADDIESALTDASADYDGIWLVAQGFTDWPNYGVVENWLAENMQLVVDTNINGLRAQHYRPWEPTPNETDEVNIAFSDIVRINGVEVLTPVQPTGELVIWVYWQPLRTTDQPLKAFVHMNGEVNPATGTTLWRQDDHEPQFGRARTTDWEPGTIYRDVFVLSDIATLPVGDYSLHLGLYDPQTGERIAIENGDTLKIGDYSVTQ